VDEVDLLPNLGIGTSLTILRGFLGAVLVGFLLSSRPSGWLGWIPALIYWVAILVDVFDGYFARITNHVTELGTRLDMEFDGWGVLIASALAVQYGQVLVWYLLVGLARYLFLGWGWLRTRFGKPVYDLPPSVRRRAMAGVQMGFIGVMLLPIFSPPGTYLAATLFMLIFLVGFLLDGLWMSGLIKPQLATHGRKYSRSYTDILLLSVRILTIGILVVMVATNIDFQEAESIQTLARYGVLLVLSVLEAVVIVMLFLGAAGRAAALAVLLMLGVHQMYASLTLFQYALVVGATLIFFFGTGPYSLWTPEDRLIRFKAGER
jgi:CDP-diacylglycerol--glycerol-3-phosphate 3-phosphatidyltransferase